MNSEFVTAITGIVIALATWGYHKIKGDKQASLADTASDLAYQALHVAVVTVESNIDELRAKATDYVWRALGRLNIPRNAVSEVIVAQVIEAGITEALAEAKAHDRAVQIAWGKSAGAILDTIPADIDSIGKPPKNPTIEPLGLDIEYREPNRDGEYKPGYAK